MVSQHYLPRLMRKDQRVPARGKRRLVGVLVASLAALASAFPALAQGSWYEGSEPPTITGPGITFYGETGGGATVVGPNGEFAFFISDSVSCPGGNPIQLTVTFSDPSGSITDTLTGACAVQGPPGCAALHLCGYQTSTGSWTTQPSSGNVDFGTHPGIGINLSLSTLDYPVESPGDMLLPNHSSSGSQWNDGWPLVYTVSGPSGTLAQGGYSIWYAPPTPTYPAIWYYKLGNWPAAPIQLPMPPQPQSPPTIAGNAIQGQTLTDGHGTWTNNPFGYGYQWEDCDSSGNNCSAILVGFSQTYTLIASDVGHTIRVLESAWSAAGAGGPVSSAATSVVQAPSPTPQPKPKPKPPTPKYVINVGNAHIWALHAADDQFYGSHYRKPANFAVKHCARLASGRFRCAVSWHKGLYVFAGSLTMGNVNPRTGHFYFGFNLVRTDTRTHARKRIVVPY